MDSCVGDQVGMNVGEGWLNEWRGDGLAQGVKKCPQELTVKAPSDAGQAWRWERFQKLEQVDRSSSARPNEGMNRPEKERYPGWMTLK